jgi:hypothetical protein
VDPVGAGVLCEKYNQNLGSYDRKITDVEDVPLGLPLPVIDAPDPMVDRPAMIIEDSAAKVTP